MKTSEEKGVVLLFHLLFCLWNSLVCGIKSARKKKPSKVSKDDRTGQKKILFLDSKCLSAICLPFIK